VTETRRRRRLSTNGVDAIVQVGDGSGEAIADTETKLNEYLDDTSATGFHSQLASSAVAKGLTLSSSTLVRPRVKNIKTQRLTQLFWGGSTTVGNFESGVTPTTITFKIATTVALSTGEFYTITSSAAVFNHPSTATCTAPGIQDVMNAVTSLSTVLYVYAPSAGIATSTQSSPTVITCTGGLAANGAAGTNPKFTAISSQSDLSSEQDGGYVIVEATPTAAPTSNDGASSSADNELVLGIVLPIVGVLLCIIAMLAVVVIVLVVCLCTKKSQEDGKGEAPREMATIEITESNDTAKVIGITVATETDDGEKE
jgi:hypothetical protein